MYQIILDNRDGEKLIIHDSRSTTFKVYDAVCDLELNKTGSLSFKLPQSHPYYDVFKKHLSEVYLLQDHEVIFCGRVINDSTDMYNNKTIICEGILGYLLDSIQRPKKYSKTGNNKIKSYITDIINNHNSQVDSYKHFSVGDITEVDETDNLEIITSYNDTLTTLNNDLVNVYNHTYLIPRIQDDIKYIDYLTSNELPTNDQIIRFGANLLSLTKSIKGEEIATAIIPLGASTGTDELDTKVDISKYPMGKIKGSIYKNLDYIYDEDAVKTYGWIFKTIEYSDIEDVDTLVNEAVKQLNYYSKLAKTIELNAFDLHLLDANIDSFRVGQKVQVFSSIHDLEDLDKYMIVQKMTININQPDKNTITLGNEERVSIDTTTSASKKLDNTDKVFSDYDKKFNDFNKKLKNLGYNGSNPDLSDYVNKGNLGTLMDDYLRNQMGTGSISDLSKYALITDVQNAFNSLANLIKGV